MIVRSARASTVWNLGASPLTWEPLHYKLQYFFRDFLSVLLQVLRLATEEDEEVDYHVIVKEHLAHKGARGVQVDATQLHSTRVWVLQIYLEVLFTYQPLFVQNIEASNVHLTSCDCAENNTNYFLLLWEVEDKEPIG